MQADRSRQQAAPAMLEALLLVGLYLAGELDAAAGAAVAGIAVAATAAGAALRRRSRADMRAGLPAHEFG